MGNAKSVCDFCCCCKNEDVAVQQTVPDPDPVMVGSPTPTSEARQALTVTDQASTSASAVAADEACQNILDLSKDGVDGDLDALINYTRTLLDYAKGSRSSSSKDGKPERKDWKFVDTTDLSKFKDMFSESADAASGLFHKNLESSSREKSPTGTFAGVPAKISNGQSATVMHAVKTVLNGIGKAHWVAAGLVAVAFVLERFDMIAENNAECVDLLDEMYRLAQYLQILKQRRSLKEHTASLMEDALQLVVEGAAVCFFQAKSSWWYKLFGANVERRQLENVHRRLEKIHRHLMFQVILRAYDANQPLPLPRMEFYPHNAVIKSETLKSIVEMLELESDKKVVVVILYGLGGIGKSTLADAVYAMVDDVLGFKFSKAALYETIGSKPNLLGVQRKILNAISGGQVNEEPSTPSDGQKLLLKYLEKEPSFVYIDNVLDGVELSKLLPFELDRSRKLRLLLTARDATVCNGVDVKRRDDVKLFNVESMEEKDAETLLEKQIGSDVVAQISNQDWQYLLSICGGMPLLIQMVGKYLRYAKNVAEALKTIRDERRHQHGQRFGGQSMEFFSFAFDTLEQSYRDAFLDICVFCLGLPSSCRGWSFVERIFGKDTMEVLQKRALVKRIPAEYTPGVMFSIDNDLEVYANVHDVMLEMGRRIGQSVRITSVSQFRSMLESSDLHSLRNIKGIYLLEMPKNGEKLILPSHKLDLMSASLRILSTDYYERLDPYNVIEIEGECKDPFPNLLYWNSLEPKSQHRLVYGKQWPELRTLFYAPSSTVPLHQLPSSLKHLCLDFSDEEFLIRDSEKPVSVEPASEMLNLENLHLQGKYLREIPAGLISHMNSLVELYLWNAEQLVHLPDELHTLPHLKSIWIHNVALTQLPESIGGCVLLNRLLVIKCNEVARLPLGMENLSSLQLLLIRECKGLEELPGNIRRLACLKFLVLSGCTNLKTLGATFHFLPSLQVLDLSDCFELEAKCMDVLTEMKSLRVLYIRGCPRLIQRWQELEKPDLNIKCIYEW